jgi:hypothetical protein
MKTVTMMTSGGVGDVMMNNTHLDPSPNSCAIYKGDRNKEICAVVAGQYLLFYCSKKLLYATKVHSVYE